MYDTDAISCNIVERSLICTTFKFYYRDCSNISYYGVYVEKQIIGFSMVECGVNSFILYHLYIVLPYRNRSVGSRFLNYLLSKAGGHMYVKFNSSDHDVNSVSSFCVKNGFLEPVVDYISYRSDRDSLGDKLKTYFTDSRSLFSLEREYNLKRFSEYSEFDIQKICSGQKNLCEYLNPVLIDEILFDDISFFIYQNDVLLGWIMGGVQDNRIIIYGTYILPEYRHSGLGLKIWMLCFMQAERSIIWSNVSYICFNFDKSEKRLCLLYSHIFRKFSKEIMYYITKK